MSTFMANPQTVERKWYVINADGKTLGKIAVETANLLRGKNKVDYTPHVDCGDHVVILNAEKVVLTGKKLEQKYYRRHTGWVGGLKEVKYSILMQENPELAVELAVKGMLPSNTIGRKALTRLRVYQGETHNHDAQKPAEWNV